MKVPNRVAKDNILSGDQLAVNGQPKQQALVIKQSDQLQLTWSTIAFHNDSLTQIFAIA